MKTEIVALALAKVCQISGPHNETKDVQKNPISSSEI
jgi:hypothetical protein